MRLAKRSCKKWLSVARRHAGVGKACTPVTFACTKAVGAGGGGVTTTAFTAALTPVGHRRQRVPPPRSHELPGKTHVASAQKASHAAPWKSGRHVAQSAWGSHGLSQLHVDADDDGAQLPCPWQVSAVQSHAWPAHPLRHSHVPLSTHTPWPEQLRPVGPTGHAREQLPAGTKSGWPRRSVGHAQRLRASHVALAARAVAGHSQSMSHARPVKPASHTHVGPAMHTPRPLHGVPSAPGGHCRHEAVKLSHPSVRFGHRQLPSASHVACLLLHVISGKQYLSQRAP